MTTPRPIEENAVVIGMFHRAYNDSGLTRSDSIRRFRRSRQKINVPSVVYAVGGGTLASQ